VQSSPRHKIASLVRQGAQVGTSLSETAQLALKQKIVSRLVDRASALKSTTLATLAMRVSSDPFLKVKELIQTLIERLVTEATEEASKKGWCDTETGKANSNRDRNFAATVELDAELEGFEARKAELEATIATLTTELAELNDALTKTSKIRGEEKAENMSTLDQAKEGLAAVKDAHAVLTAFYAKAAKGTVSLLAVSPVDADAPAVHSGANNGSQQKAGGILAMLDVIVSDFQRTIKVTTKSEQSAHREFTEFARTTKASLMSKETDRKNSEADLKETDSHIMEGMSDLTKHRNMLDESLKELEDLKPDCVDTGMSFEERTQKRKDEIDALRSALCQLDGDNVEDECK